jgi:hypothetical protein
MKMPELTIVLKTLEAPPGSVVVLESQDRLTCAQHKALRTMFSKRLPDGVFFIVTDHPFDVRAMPEAEQRALMDTLCGALNMRAVPL